MAKSLSLALDLTTKFPDQLFQLKNLVILVLGRDDLCRGVAKRPPDGQKFLVFVFWEVDVVKRRSHVVVAPQLRRQLVPQSAGASSPFTPIP